MDYELYQETPEETLTVEPSTFPFHGDGMNHSRFHESSNKRSYNHLLMLEAPLEDPRTHSRATTVPLRSGGDTTDCAHAHIL